MLASGAILDYGSIRQFAAKHDKYRYEDVDRFSASLTEQRFWARQLVKVFAQAFEFALTGRKRPLNRYGSLWCLREFDEAFRMERDRRMLWRVGFTPEQIDKLLKRAKREIGDFRRALEFFEDAKVARGVEKLKDGITHRPIFLIRNLLRALPEYYVAGHNGERGTIMPANLFCRIMAASYVSRRDRKMTPSRIARARNFQLCYQRLIAKAGPSFKDVLNVVQQRSAIINHPHRITGDAVIWIVTELIEQKKTLDRDELQELMDRFIESQILVPGKFRPIEESEMNGTSNRAQLLRAIQDHLEEHKEAV
jgi:hypothetical protein